jgi:cytidylate kinase
VIEGRDIGSVVFPDAVVKVFLTASPEERARRRAQEMTDLEFDQVASDLARRDARDENRADSPLHAASDADVVDTTGLDIDEVVERISALVDERS